MAVVKEERPALSIGSRDEPLCSNKAQDTIGISGFSKTIIFRPVGEECSSGNGGLNIASGELLG
tara:strand:+ start:987 stop:1178 length:192 start_codon:yes stop_codon:yes gene_type:complete